VEKVGGNEFHFLFEIVVVCPDPDKAKRDIESYVMKYVIIITGMVATNTKHSEISRYSVFKNQN
jgi:hypothetical protein